MKKILDKIINFILFVLTAIVVNIAFIFSMAKRDDPIEKTIIILMTIISLAAIIYITV